MNSYNPEHPFDPARRYSFNPPTTSAARDVPAMRSVVMGEKVFLVGPHPPRITFNHPSSPHSPAAARFNVRLPFRQLREKFTASRCDPTIAVKSPEPRRPSSQTKYKPRRSTEPSQLLQAKQKPEVKSFFKETKANTLEMAPDPCSQTLPSRQKQEGSLGQEGSPEQLVLEESRILAQQVTTLKRKIEEYEDVNNRLRAEILALQCMHALEDEQNTLQSQNSQIAIEREIEELIVQLKKFSESESRLEQQRKKLELQLSEAKLECMLAKIAESEASRRCRELAEETRQQQLQIRLFRQQSAKKENGRSSEPSAEGETVTYFLI